VATVGLGPRKSQKQKHKGKTKMNFLVPAPTGAIVAHSAKVFCIKFSQCEEVTCHPREGGDPVNYQHRAAFLFSPGRGERLKPLPTPNLPAHKKSRAQYPA